MEQFDQTHASNHQPAEQDARDDRLEQRVKKFISTDIVPQVLDHAYLLQRREGHVDQLAAGTQIPISTLYELADKDGIDHRHVDVALGRYFPSQQEQRAALDSLKATPTGRALKVLYQRALLQEFPKAVPGLKISSEYRYVQMQHELIFLLHTRRKEVSKNWLGKERVRHIDTQAEIGELIFPYACEGESPCDSPILVRIIAYNPLFLSVVGDRLKELAKALPFVNYNVAYDYTSAHV